MENKMMAMRTALRDISRVAEEMTRNTMSGKPEDRHTVDGWALRICDIIGSALDVPLRNCDVGTADEQELRYQATGELYHTLTLQDALAWAQRPYEEGGEK